jgi:hypothetical protein
MNSLSICAIVSRAIKALPPLVVKLLRVDTVL